MNLKKLYAVLIAGAMVLSMAACGQEAAPADTSKPAEQKETSATPATDESKKEEEPEADSSAASEAVGILTAEEMEAMKKEPAYNSVVKYWYDGGNCTSAPYMAEKLGYFQEYGIQSECLNGTAIKEALGTGASQIGVSHIASLLVPITNNVEYTFVAGAHVGCKSLYVLGSGPVQSTADLVGTKVAVPNGIGNSDYNITARLLDADGINPMTDVELTPVENSACVAALQSGEISSALLSDTYAYKMVQDGTLRRIRSLIDDDFSDEACCVLAMNNTFIKENPLMAKAVTDCVKRAGEWNRNNTKEAVQTLIDDGKMSGDFDMNCELWDTLKFGLSDEFTETSLKVIVDDYKRLGLITSDMTAEEIMAKAWNPQAPDK